MGDLTVSTSGGVMTQPDSASAETTIDINVTREGIRAGHLSHVLRLWCRCSA
ncbi:hypothetical protein [Cellulomonas chengniuliangii]|uniref:hypothetical protein n=1 Tax=Cellulomonas chengniuliangii TaxID=2968084 RepID=UPI001D0F20F6|nr:hypothetical protein [Cellulomonas chengniuliangii]